MPTVLRLDGLRVVIYPNDHRPEHVHVIGAGCEAVFELHCPDGQITLREFCGFTKRRLSQLIDELEAAQAQLCDAWEEIHDTD